MWNLLPQGSYSKKGFTLIEIVIAIGFAGMMILMFFSIMTFTKNTTKKIQVADDYLLDGRYVTEYISEDVILADEIISMDDYCPGNCTKEDTLGFFLINKLLDKDNKVYYQHIYYRLTSGSLYRTTSNSIIRCPNTIINNGGNNRFLDHVIEIKNSCFNSEDCLIYLEIKTMDSENNKEYIFTETKYLGKF